MASPEEINPGGNVVTTQLRLFLHDFAVKAEDEEILALSAVAAVLASRSGLSIGSAQAEDIAAKVLAETQSETPTLLNQRGEIEFDDEFRQQTFLYLRKELEISPRHLAEAFQTSRATVYHWSYTGIKKISSKSVENAINLAGSVAHFLKHNVGCSDEEIREFLVETKYEGTDMITGEPVKGKVIEFIGRPDHIPNISQLISKIFPNPSPISKSSSLGN